MKDKGINKSMPKQVKHNRAAQIFNPSPNWIPWFWLRTCWNSRRMMTLFWFIFKDLVCRYSKLYQVDSFQTSSIQAHFSGACIYLILAQRISFMLCSPLPSVLLSTQTGIYFFLDSRLRFCLPHFIYHTIVPLVQQLLLLATHFE